MQSLWLCQALLLLSNPYIGDETITFVNLDSDKGAHFRC